MVAVTFVTTAPIVVTAEEGTNTTSSPTIMGSKVLRIDTDGNAAPDNAPPEGFDKRTYSYGYRNVQSSKNEPPIVAEHGPWHSDEVTVLVNGGNGGWDPRPNLAGGKKVNGSEYLIMLLSRRLHTFEMP